MIISNKNAPLSLGADSGAVKIVQNDCITIPVEKYDVLIIQSHKIDLIIEAVTSPLMEYELKNHVALILGLPEEVKSYDV